MIQERKTESYVPTNIYANAPLPAEIKRVAVFPVYYGRQEGDFLDEIDNTFASELSRRIRFEVVRVSREEMKQLFNRRQLSSVSNLPRDLFAKLKAHYHVDGILFTDLTQYTPYSPIVIGVRSKLVDVTSGQVVWAFDDVFDSTIPEVAMAARRFDASNGSARYPFNDGRGVLLSPSRFSKYVANSVYFSLPEREMN